MFQQANISAATTYTLCTNTWTAAGDAAADDIAEHMIPLTRQCTSLQSMQMFCYELLSAMNTKKSQGKNHINTKVVFSISQSFCDKLLAKHFIAGDLVGYKGTPLVVTQHL